MIRARPALAFLAWAAASGFVGASATEPSRVLSGVSLGISDQDAGSAFKLRDITTTYKENPLSRGERAYSMSPSLPGSSGMIGRFYRGRLWRLEISFPHAYAERTAWARFIAEPSGRYGTPATGDETIGDFWRRLARWTGEETGLTYESETRLGRVATKYRIVLEDLATVNELALGALKSAIPPSNAAPAKEQSCSSFSGCLELALDSLKGDDCAGAVAAASLAVSKAPGIPDGYYYRAEAEHLSGDEDSARADMERAARLDPRFVVLTDPNGLPTTNREPCWRRASPKPALTR